MAKEIRIDYANRYIPEHIRIDKIKLDKKEGVPSAVMVGKFNGNVLEKMYNSLNEASREEGVSVEAIKGAIKNNTKVNKCFWRKV